MYADIVSDRLTSETSVGGLSAKKSGYLIFSRRKRSAAYNSAVTSLP